MTIPTLSVSKLRAIPLAPDLNSTISPAWTLVRPKTLAIPSPMEMTDPNSFKSFYRASKKKVSIQIREVTGKVRFMQMSRLAQVQKLSNWLAI